MVRKHAKASAHPFNAKSIRSRRGEIESYGGATLGTKLGHELPFFLSYN